MSVERTAALFGTWRRVNDIASTTEDSQEIRWLIAEAGIEARAHVGTDPADFSPEMAAEWVLGQWADLIDHESPFTLNTARNVSIGKYEEFVGPYEPPPSP